MSVIPCQSLKSMIYAHSGNYQITNDECPRRGVGTAYDVP